MPGLLKKSMYGTQDAPAIWQARYTKLLIDNGSVFCHPDGARVVVHWGLHDQESLQRLNDILKTAYELKWLGIFLEADRRHVDLQVQQLGVASAKGVERPM